MKKLLSFFTFVVLSTAFIILTPAANAGIEETDHKKEWESRLEELRTEIKDNSYAYTVDYNPACQYSPGHPSFYYLEFIFKRIPTSKDNLPFLIQSNWG